METLGTYGTQDREGRRRGLAVVGTQTRQGSRRVLLEKGTPTHDHTHPQILCVYAETYAPCPQ
jgi:quercetin dioxygenase-like cupin family protein